MVEVTVVKPVIVALDFPDARLALNCAERLDPQLCRLKVGKELFTREGPAIVKALHQQGFDIFLDLKFHDIPNTVAKACVAAAELDVWMVNVHASGGSSMMQQAVKQMRAVGASTLLTAVTVLTSMNQQQLLETGIDQSIEQRVLQLARLAQTNGLDGVVCSALEAQLLREKLGEDFLLVTPGIRPANSAADDQQRIVTPAQGLQYGASYLVIGRPITQATDPAAALQSIVGQFAAG